MGARQIQNLIDERRRERMIRLTRRSGESETINPDRIEKIEDAHADGGSRIIFASGDNRAYAETREEVVRKVLEWRLAMEDYRHDFPFVKTKAMSLLVKLAGLEEPNHDEG